MFPFFHIFTSIHLLVRLNAQHTKKRVSTLRKKRAPCSKLLSIGSVNYTGNWCVKRIDWSVYAAFTITSTLTWDSPHLMAISWRPSDFTFSFKTKRLSNMISYSFNFSTISSLVTEPKVVVVSGIAARTNSRGPGSDDKSAKSFRAAVSWRLIPILGSTVYFQIGESINFCAYCILQSNTPLCCSLIHFTFWATGSETIALRSRGPLNLVI